MVAAAHPNAAVKGNRPAGLWVLLALAYGAVCFFAGALLSGLMPRETTSRGTAAQAAGGAVGWAPGQSPARPAGRLAPFYVPAPESVLREIGRSGLEPASDKVAPPFHHAYGSLYSTLLDHRRHEPLKMLEIGLGCDMGQHGDKEYGPGGSAILWRTYMPKAELWLAEYNASCVEHYGDMLRALRVNTLIGDQADHAVLGRWVEASGGGFDVIVDDGGHQNHHIFNSLQVLFPKALKPGGVYIIEDLQVSRWPSFRGPPNGPMMMDVLRDYLESLLAPRLRFGKMAGLKGGQPLQPGRHVLPVGVKQIMCGSEICAIFKCTEDDDECPTGGTFNPVGGSRRRL